MAAPLPAPPAELPGGWEWEQFMLQALDAAGLGLGLGEVPVGAALLSAEGELVATACNAPVSSHDPTAHAEIRCLRLAAERIGNYRLTGCIMAVTIEPCLMCAGALVHARMAGVVYGASDPRTGALESCLALHELDFLNHRFWLRSGILQEECSTIIKGFFRERRNAD